MILSLLLLVATVALLCWVWWSTRSSTTITFTSLDLTFQDGDIMEVDNERFVITHVEGERVTVRRQ